jgi:hypothetical protein
MRKVFGVLTFVAVMILSAQAATNLVSNGDFSAGSQDWVAGKWEGGFFTDTYTNNEFTATINAPGTAAWNCFFYHSENILLKAGKDYVYSFDAYATVEATVPIAVKHVGQKPAPVWLETTAAVTTTKQTFSFPFNTNGADDDSGQVTFQLGATVFTTGDVFHLSNVSIAEAGSSSVKSKTVAAALPKNLRVAGTRATVTLTRAGTSELKLYSLQGALVADYSSSLKAGSNQIDLLSRNVAGGAYVLKLRDGSAVSAAAVMIGR